MTSSNRNSRFFAFVTATAFTSALTRPAAANELRPPTISLTLRSDAPGTRLQRLAGVADIYLGADRGVAEVWTDLCVAPCAVDVAADDRLRLAGGAIETTAFDLRPDQRHADVSVRAGSKPQRQAGQALSIFGAVAVVAGASLLGVAASVEPPSSGPFADPAFAAVNGDRAAQASSLRTIGVIALVAGGVGLLIGLPTYAANRTAIKID